MQLQFCQKIQDYLHYLGSEIISHFVMHGPSIAEIIKHLISVLKKTNSDYIPTMFLEALKKVWAYSSMSYFIIS